MLLAIDTSSRCAGAALADADGTVLEARLWRASFSHTAQLFPAVAELLAAQGIQAAGLSGVAVALGPGPFSALRVGVSAAKGLALAGGFPIIGIDTLTLEAGPHLGTAPVVSAWLEAGRREVAAAWFDAHGNRIAADAVAPPESLLRQDAADFATVAYCGEAAAARAPAIRAAQSGPETQPNPDAQSGPPSVAPWTPATRLWHLAYAGAQRLYQGDTSDLAALQPYYLRMPTIGAPRQRDRVRPGRPAAPPR